MATFLARALGLIEVPVPSASGYTDISIDSRFTCALRLGGTVECWGRLNYEGESEPSQDVEISAPDGRYKDLDHGSRSGCDLHALRQDGAIECWTLKEVESDWDLGAGPPWVRPAELVVAENSDVPPGSFVSVDGDCGIRADGTITCWANPENSQPLGPPPDGTFTSVAVGHSGACGIRADGTIACWPNEYNWFIRNAPSSPLAIIDIGPNMYGDHGAAAGRDGTVFLWGRHLPPCCG